MGTTKQRFIPNFAGQWKELQETTSRVERGATVIGLGLSSRALLSTLLVALIGYSQAGFEASAPNLPR
jgi:hypothetical protein